jgi:DNA-binding NarL/FixJ family response regulator
LIYLGGFKGVFTIIVPKQKLKNKQASILEAASGQNSSENDPEHTRVRSVRALGARTQNREIALALDIKERTVRFHVGNILDKLGVENRTQAVCCALRMGWTID